MRVARIPRLVGALVLALVACSAPVEPPPTLPLATPPRVRPVTEALRIPIVRPIPERVIDQASASCPATPLEVVGSVRESFFERDGATARLREPEGPWRADQPRAVLWLPLIYYTLDTFEVLAERLDAPAPVQIFVARLEGAGYHAQLALPTAGCWRLTARLGEDRGSVVVPVEP